MTKTCHRLKLLHSSLFEVAEIRRRDDDILPLPFRDSHRN